MKKYFIFYEESMIERGVDNVSVYNLINTNIYYFDKPWEVALIDGLSSSIELDLLVEKISNSYHIEFKAVLQFIKQLEEAHLGVISNSAIVKLDLVKPQYWRDLIFFKTPLSLSKVFIYFGGNCHKKCIHCNSDTIISEKRCYSCSGGKSNPSIAQVDQMIEIAKNSNCKDLILIGGDLLQNKSPLSHILDIVQNDMSTTVIAGFQKDYDKNIINVLAQCSKLQLEVFPEDLRTPSFEEFSNKMVNISANLYVNVLSSSAKEYPNQLLPVFVQRSYETIHTVRLVERNKLEQVLAEEERFIPATNCDDYMYKTVFNTCMNGVLTLKNNGSLYVCPKIEDTYLGKIDDCATVLEGKNINKFWKLSKRKIPHCKNCSLNKTCLDCRYLAYFLYGDLNKMYPCEKI